MVIVNMEYKRRGVRNAVDPLYVNMGKRKLDAMWTNFVWTELFIF